MIASRWHRCTTVLRCAYGEVGRRCPFKTSSAVDNVRPACVGSSARRLDDSMNHRPRSDNRLFFSSSSSSSSSSSPLFDRSEYVHPLSQIVLERLQSHHADWVTRVGLNTGLRFNVDGTFILRFPSSSDIGHTIPMFVGKEAADVGSVGSPGHVGDEMAGGSIWTMYEPEEKKHYLCVKRGGLLGRYMLQDNKKPAWHTDRRSTPERVQDAVDEMIAKFDEVR